MLCWPGGSSLNPAQWLAALVPPLTTVASVQGRCGAQAPFEACCYFLISQINKGAFHEDGPVLSHVSITGLENTVGFSRISSPRCLPRESAREERMGVRRGKKEASLVPPHALTTAPGPGQAGPPFSLSAAPGQRDVVSSQ